MITSMSEALSIISRRDTNSFNSYRCWMEVQAWQYIISNILNEEPQMPVADCVISNRLSKCLAKVSWKGGKYECTLTVSQKFIEHHSDVDKFHSVMCHEAIHTFYNCQAHTGRFKTIGERIMREFKNIEISRTIGDEGYQEFRQGTRKEEMKKFKLVCNGCGQTIYRARLSKFVMHPDHFRCGRCGGKFTRYQMDIYEQREHAAAQNSSY